MENRQCSSVGCTTDLSAGVIHHVAFAREGDAEWGVKLDFCPVHGPVFLATWSDILDAQSVDEIDTDDPSSRDKTEDRTWVEVELSEKEHVGLLNYALSQAIANLLDPTIE